MSDLTKRIKELAYNNYLDYVGVASAESLNDEPEFMKPQDFFPGAQSVISLGKKLTLGSQLANRMAHRYHRNLIYAYL